MSDESKTNLATFRAPERSDRGPAPGGDATMIHFSPDELDSIWNQVIADAGDRSNEEFRKEFEKALRSRAMRKLMLFGGDGLEISLATGKNWAQESWVAQEAADGSLVLTKVKSG